MNYYRVYIDLEKSFLIRASGFWVDDLGNLELCFLSDEGEEECLALFPRENWFCIIKDAGI
jgi:hypothetical protein